MRNSNYYLLAFNSTHDAVAAEKYLLTRLKVTMMPTLRKITASCGISVRIEEADFDQLKEMLDLNAAAKKSCMPNHIKGEEVIPIEI